ncbi:MAG: hypothetical protein APF81_16695 [Desulfosporosinus sp. BRH_c37]|nr:MAG: hypothetical protein APF81_16695 [Desulfosporosinus sp. BRH_c37]
MKILIFAGLTAIICFLIFFIIDKKKAKDSDEGDAQNHTEEKKSKAKSQKEQRAAFNDLGLPIYDEYQMSRSQKVVSVVLASAVIFCLAYLFYMNYIVSIILACGGLLFPKMRKKQLIEIRKRNLTSQFKNLLSSVSSSLAAGRSVENSFKAASEDLKMLYPNQNTDILKEIQWLVHKIGLNEPVEMALVDFANRSNIDEIASFATVFTTCKKTGGDLVNVVRSTSNIITEKIEIKNDIYLTLAAKKMEQKVLMVVPFIIVAFLAFSTGDFMYPMYHSFIGRAVMTIGWVLILGVWFITEHIMNIKV